MLECNHVSLSAATTGTGTAVQLGGQCDGFRVYVVGASGVSSGAIIVEEAIETDYAGTWGVIASGITVPDGSITVIAQAAGGVMAIRARVTTTVAGGGAPSVTVRIVGYSGAGA